MMASVFSHDVKVYRFLVKLLRPSRWLSYRECPAPSPLSIVLQPLQRLCCGYRR